MIVITMAPWHFPVFETADSTAKERRSPAQQLYWYRSNMWVCLKMRHSPKRPFLEGKWWSSIGFGVITLFSDFHMCFFPKSRVLVYTFEMSLVSQSATSSHTVRVVPKIWWLGCGTSCFCTETDFGWARFDALKIAHLHFRHDRHATDVWGGFLE